MKSRQRRLTTAICTFTAMLMGGCASNLTEEEQYQLQASYDERRDQIRSYIHACEAAGNVVMYTGPSTHKLRDPVKRIPRHASTSDYQCGSTQDMERFQIEMGIR